MRLLKTPKPPACRCHWKVAAGWLFTTAVNVAGWPAISAIVCGISAKTGFSPATQSWAAALVAAGPLPLLATRRNRSPAMAAVTALTVSAEEVVPE